MEKRSELSFRKKNLHISYTTARENVLDALNKIGLNSKKFGLHRLKAKEATATVTLSP